MWLRRLVAFVRMYWVGVVYAMKEWLVWEQRGPEFAAPRPGLTAVVVGGGGEIGAAVASKLRLLGFRVRSLF